MRTRVDAKAFIQALDRVSGLIRKSAIPVLNAVLVRFEEDRCTLTSTNIEAYLSAVLPAQGDAFAFLLDRPRETARAFRQFEGELALEQTETGEGDRRRIKLVLSCGPRSAELHPFLPEDFPRHPVWEPKHSFTTNASRLYARVERVKYAVGASIIGDKNAKTVNLNVFGAIFSRINADLWDRTVTVGQRVRPILYETEDAEALGLTMTGTSSISPAMINFFKEGHCDLGGGKPFSFQFGRYKWDGT